MFNNIFQNKRVIVTGDTGFKGSWLSLWLHELGANVLGYALPPKQENDHFHLLKLNNIIKHIDGDICDYSKVQQIFNEFKPEILRAPPRLGETSNKLDFCIDKLKSTGFELTKNFNEEIDSTLLLCKNFRNKNGL